ncbi:MAG: Asp-tRNA(Asn)/Glu-tRNA(Gln) amidotransferase subunit GatA [Planctomycetes bacterium]|nr:Asp-tRNA(Asn)/Glu-tRNA(Gln) amidotransferase subunit GatA [Planctomycetota bacterium]
MLDDLKSASEIVNAVNDKIIKAQVVTEFFIERIKNIDPKIQAFLRFDTETALKQAHKVDDKIQKGEKVGKLAGLPIAVKDNISIKDDALSCGSKILDGYTALYDATAIAKLKAEDAIILGRTNLDEFAMGSSCENSSFFPTKNPFDVEKTPGGSSGGSAAAVASWQIPAALGSDTGGSIRQPASFCGIVGFKPTYGHVSRYGLVAFGSSLDQIGPMTRTVEDAALLYDVISGYDPQDSTSIPDKPENIYEDLLKFKGNFLKGKKVAIVEEALGEGLQDEIAQNLDEFKTFLMESGAKVTTVSLPNVKYAVAVYVLVATSEASANLARFDGMRYGARKDGADLEEVYLRTRSEGFGEEVRRRIMLGTFALRKGYADKYYLRALKVRSLMIEDFKKAFKTCDFLLLPTTPTTAFNLGEKLDDPLSMYLNDIYTASANLAGVPAISIPSGLDGAGLPIGMQLIAPLLQESALFHAANEIYKHTSLKYNFVPKII